MAVVGVIGAGISGLSAAHFLSKLARSNVKKVIVYEASDRVGGWIQTTRFPDGTLFEHGPRTVRPIGIAAQTALRLVEDVGLSMQVLFLTGSHPAAARRMIYAKGQLHYLPSQISDLLKVRPPFSKAMIKYLTKEMVTKRGRLEDESVYDFVSRRFGDELARYAADAMCLGIFAGDSRKLSAKSCFPLLWDKEKDRGSVVRGFLAPTFGAKESESAMHSKLSTVARSGRWFAWSLQEGLETLPRAVETELLSDNFVEIRRNDPVTKLGFLQSGKVEIDSASGRSTVDHVVSSVFAPQLSQMLPPDMAPLAADLRSISAVTVAVLNLQFPGDILQHLPAFGYLVPSVEQSPLLGVIFDSWIFPQHAKSSDEQPITQLTCMLGGAYFDHYFGPLNATTEQRILEAARMCLEQQLNITGTPLRYSLRVHQNCIPQYHVGHAEKLARIKGFIAHNKLEMSLIGSSYGGVSVNDCIHGGKKVAEKLAQFGTASYASYQ
ncbi:protoporphyrinogen oxidase-like [Paramacrobiotus metropolitanus]|uniref:protoporphyrinogen oxidase-like n=1 Tax=Paramacrobiotus metropolitanus TaxID=2943436 RepID=UPI0024457E43|nr:protoporphyrinogen oxidase-like [Paramacrobiotus metropolitanus]